MKPGVSPLAIFSEITRWRSERCFMDWPMPFRSENEDIIGISPSETREAAERPELGQTALLICGATTAAHGHAIDLRFLGGIPVERATGALSCILMTFHQIARLY